MNRFLWDKIVRLGNISVFPSTNYQPGYEPVKIKNIWTDFVFRSAAGTKNASIDIEAKAGASVASKGCAIYGLNLTSAYATLKLQRHLTDQKAVADDGGGKTDESTEANDTTEDDMILLPATPAENDAYYFGSTNFQFSSLELNIGINGDGVWTITWEYYNGSAWVSLSDISDGTTGFTEGTGWRVVGYTLPENWAKTTVDSKNAYWIRARVSAYTSIVTQPKGTQSRLLNDVANFDYDADNGRAIAFYSEVSSVIYRVVMNDTNVASYVQLGVIVLGDYEQISRLYEYGSTWDLDDASVHRYSKEGYLNVAQGRDIEGETVVYEVLAADESKLENVYKQVRKKFPFVFVRDHADSKGTMKYVVMAGKFGRGFPENLFRTISLSWLTVK